MSAGAERQQLSWPEGLSEKEAVQRLQTLFLGACDGVQDLADEATTQGGG